MKVEQRVLDYASTLEGERVGMTIDQGALAHIMAVLTDLYSDPELACLREYSTNALDSHVEAGNPAPIEVTLPTQLAPFLRVRDYGVGLDAEGIREVYSRYGTSTKRDSNDVVGMLGLGCKSALTYADQFTLIGTKDGTRTQVLVSRDENGSGSMTIVSVDSTTDPNGLEVVIPAKRGHDFTGKAASFFRYWQPGTVLVNGEQPKRIDGLWLAPDLLLSSEVDGDTIVMGNVPYPFPDGTQRDRHWRAPSVVAFVPIGTVSFTPSREQLQATKGTKAAVEAIKARVVAELDAAVKAQVAAATTAADAQRLLREGRAAGFKGDATWQGHTVVLELDRTPAKPANVPNGSYWRAPNPDDSPAASFLKVGQSYGRRKGERVWQVKCDPALRWFTGYGSKDMTPTKRDKLETWAAGKGLSVGSCVMVEQLTPAELVWLDPAMVHPWADVDAVKLPKREVATNADGRPRGSYSALVNGQRMQVHAVDIDGSAPLYWLHGSDYAISGHTALRAKLVDPDTCTIVALPGNRVDKFCRDFPNAVELGKAAREAAQAKLDALDPAEVEAYRVQLGSDVADLRGLDPARFTDPDLQRMTKLANAKTDNVAALAQACKHWLDLTGLRAKQVSWRSGYPLLQRGYGRLTSDLAEHLYLYANAAHAQRVAADSAGSAS